VAQRAPATTMASGHDPLDAALAAVRDELDHLLRLLAVRPPTKTATAAIAGLRQASACCTFAASAVQRARTELVA
jgi:hypothetical protein